MRHFTLIITLLYLIATAPTAMAQYVMPNDRPASAFDTLLMRLGERALKQKDLELGFLDLRTYTTGTSHCIRRGLVARLIPHLVPFQAHTYEDLGFEAMSHVHYQWPGDMHLNTVGLKSNDYRKARNVMERLYEGMLPAYAIKHHGDYGSVRSFVLPFYDQGFKRYRFEQLSVHDSTYTQLREAGINPDTMDLCLISFKPKHFHHTLLTGNVLIDKKTLNVLGLKCSGRINWAKFQTTIHYAPDSLHDNIIVPSNSVLSIRYHILNTHAQNNYSTTYNYKDFTPFDSIDQNNIPLDLTRFYREEKIEEMDFDMLRPIPIPTHVDSLIKSTRPKPTSHRKKRKIYRGLEEFSETLFDGTRIGPEDNRLRIYGPLDPSYLGYDKFNGFTFRERARWTKRLKNDTELFMRGELGYAFRLRELRYRLFSEWTYSPKRRGRWTFEIYRTNSTFSNKFIRTVNEALKSQNAKNINFDSLGIEYYKRYEFDLLHSIEIRNGLMLHTGALFTYRNPVRHGMRKISKERLDELIDTYYSDFAPYIRLEWTPRQYYWYKDGYKEYVHSPSPTMAFEIARAIPGAFGTDGNYGRMEFDIQQNIRLERTRFLSYHFGMGKFFNQKGEYFINYRYFKRSNYPTVWEDDRIGGTFHLLDDYWYASSPSYIQGHIMHETPFGILHLLHPLSRFIIKERIYLGALWTEGHSLFHELGYGIDNNYLNVGFFVGFKDAKYYDFGFKLRIEIGRHI
ncbi:MAG: hypothetical protein IKX59_05985 [Bacteroidales bacterium]|nr:hypothetical protein [Bacteroidales bacterium]